MFYFVLLIVVKVENEVFTIEVNQTRCLGSKK